MSFLKLCGCEESCFKPGKHWGHFEGTMCEHLEEIPVGAKCRDTGDIVDPYFTEKELLQKKAAMYELLELKLCGYKEDCFTEPETWGDLSGLICQHLEQCAQGYVCGISAPKEKVVRYITDGRYKDLIRLREKNNGKGREDNQRS